METINNVASMAAKAVWGEDQKTQEPVSGRSGDTAKGEPYDAGNLDETSGKASHVGTESNTTSTAKEPNLTKTDDAGVHAKTTGVAKEPETAPNNPSANLKTTQAPADTTKGQNDIRDPENPQTHPKGAPTDVDDTGDGPNEAQKLEGPGPKPLEEVAKEHGGDAGVKDNDTTGAKSKPAGGATGTDANDELHQESKGEGTGELYVKSSGLKADGGDFDATKPGAGREADRLLEGKGIHKTANPSKPDSTDDSKDTKHSSDAASDDKDKVSLKDKIKAKLHKH